MAPPRPTVHSSYRRYTGPVHPELQKHLRNYANAWELHKGAVSDNTPPFATDAGEMHLSKPKAVSDHLTATSRNLTDTELALRRSLKHQIAADPLLQNFVASRRFVFVDRTGRLGRTVLPVGVYPRLKSAELLK